MSTPYIGEIRMFGGNFAPAGWAFCNGQLLAISENEALFTLIGTTYGGDGQSTFALPDLQGRIPIQQGTGPDGSSYVLGQRAGAETVTLTTQQIPGHTHALLATDTAANEASPAGHVLARSNTVDAYLPSDAATAMSAQAVAAAGGSQPHGNLQPFLCVSFIISLFGIFPSPT